jgi:hypothetical protein
MKKIILVTIFIFFSILSIFLYSKTSDNKDYSKKIQVCKTENNNQSAETGANYLLPCLEKIFNNDGDFLSNAKAYIDLSKNNQGLGVYCHQILHYIGGNYPLEKYQSVSYNKDDFELVLPSCGYGFLHGFFENTPITGNNIKDSKLLLKICEPLSTYPNKNLKLECYHAIGHAVSDKYNGVDRGKNLCSEVYQQNSEALIGCFGGISMKIRDKILVKINMGEIFPPTLAWFNEVGSSCQDGDFLWKISCAPGFVQLATDQGIEYIKPFLSWCDSTLMPESIQCYQQAGVYMGHFKDKLGTAQELISICTEATNDSNYISTCINSIPEGRMNAGASKEDAVKFLCVNRDEFDYCEDLYKKYLS